MAGDQQSLVGKWVELIFLSLKIDHPATSQMPRMMTGICSEVSDGDITFENAGNPDQRVRLSLALIGEPKIIPAPA